MQNGTRLALNQLVHVLQTRVLLRTLIDEDTTQNDMSTILQDLSRKVRGVKEGKGGKEEGRRRKTKKIVKTGTKVALN